MDSIYININIDNECAVYNSSACSLGSRQLIATFTWLARRYARQWGGKAKPNYA